MPGSIQQPIRQHGKHKLGKKPSDTIKNPWRIVDLRFINIWLVVYLPLWKMMDFVSWDDYSIPKWMEKKSCSKPPTRKYYGISWIFNRHVHRFSMVFSWFSHGFPMVFPWIPKRPTDLCVLSWKNSGPRDGFAAHVEELRDLLQVAAWPALELWSFEQNLEISMMCITTEKGGKHKNHVYIYIYMYT